MASIITIIHDAIVIVPRNVTTLINRHEFASTQSYASPRYCQAAMLQMPQRKLMKGRSVRFEDQNKHITTVDPNGRNWVATYIENMQRNYRTQLFNC